MTHLRALPLIAGLCLLSVSFASAQPQAQSCSQPELPFGGTNGTPSNFTDTVVVSDSIVIGELQATVDLSHIWIGDVELDLQSPNLTVVRLHNGGGGEADDLRLTYADSGPANGSLPYSYGCTMQPSGPGVMADFNGANSAGSWSLIVNDNFPTEDDGVFHSWCVQVYSSSAGAPSPAVTDLICTVGSAPDTADLLWNNPTTYQSISISAGGIELAQLPGDATSYSGAPLSGTPPHRFAVTAVVAGSAPSCTESCLLQTLPIGGVEACSTPNLVLTDGPHIDTINISDPVTVGDAQVRLRLEHSWIGDLDIDLTSPGGGTVRLHNQGGGEADDIDVVYSDDGVANGLVDYGFGCYLKPSGPGFMADLAGTAAGDWVLSLEDNFPDDDNGLLHEWCVRTYENPPSSAPPAITGLACAPGVTPGSADLTWSVSAPYESIIVTINSTVAAVLPGDSVSFSTAEFPTNTLLDICVEGTFAGSAPSCRQCCSVEIVLEYNAFIRGDANANGTPALNDAVLILSYLFANNGAELTCHDAADVNDDEAITLSDAILLLSHLFVGGTPLPAPAGACGIDPTQSTDLTCQEYAPCLGVTNVALAGHVLRRIGFGPSPEDLDRVLAIGVLPYVDEQLDPVAIDESANVALNNRLAALNPDSNLDHLYREQVVRALYSQRQLQEQMTSFWEAHFNTYFWTLWGYFVGLPIYNSNQAIAEATLYESRENSDLRATALGTFQELVEISATSVPMLVYLDNITNVAGNPNENYARELLELHTLGVDNGYTQQDVEEAARCFTGWNICKKAPIDVGDPLAPCVLQTDPNGEWSFHFEPGLHDYDSKLLFVGTAYQFQVPARTPGSPEGLNDGFELIAHLATLPQTAEFVSTKLIHKYVSDTAPLNLVAECVGTWLNSGGDIFEVMDTILHSSEFLGGGHRWNKVETPVESIVSTVRAVGGDSDGVAIINAMNAMAQLPFNFFTPDGYPESGFDQVGTSRILERIRFAQRLYGGSGDPAANITQLLTTRGVTLDSEPAVVDELLLLFYQGQHTADDRQHAIEFLETDDNQVAMPLDPAAGDYEDRLRKLVAFIASWPQGLKQ